MLKPVSILSLDAACAPLAEAVAQRVAAFTRLDDLVQCRTLGDVAEAIESIHERRQSPDSPLRLRDDVSSRELVLLVVSACGPARTTVLETAQRIRELYRMRRLAEFYALEILCLLPDVFSNTANDDYGAAYSLLKQASSIEPKPFDAFWLMASTNAQRVRFARVDQSLEPYADAIAGVLTHEPELSGALAGAFRPRGMDATFSSFGYAELVFPREIALQRLEARLASELVRAKLLGGAASGDARLAAKQLIVGDAFANPLSRVGLDAGQSLFKRFQAKTFVTETTRSADEVIAAVRNELKVHRDSVHTQNLQSLAVQSEATSKELTALLTRVVDETLDREGFDAAIALLDALLDPLPDLRPDALSPRNVVTEINTATAALDQRLLFAPNTAASAAARKRVRELGELLRDQKLVADTIEPVSAAAQLAGMEQERDELLRQLPEILFAEETENNAARNAAREAEAQRLAAETAAREQSLRDLFAQKSRAEQALAEALETRRRWLWQQTIWLVLGVAAAFAPSMKFRITELAVVGLVLYFVWAAFRYVTTILPPIRAARETLARLLSAIETTDRAKNSAHNDELQFEYDVSHRKASLRVLQRVRDACKALLDSLRARLSEIESLSFALPSIATSALAISIVDDADVDGWYEGTADDRKPLFREFPLSRSEARRLPVEELRARVVAHAAGGFGDFRKLTIGDAAARVAADVTRKLKRLAESSAPMVEVRDDDPEAQRAMQRDTTMWLDEADAAFVAQIRKRLLDAHVRPAGDPLRVNVLSRVLHYPGYVLGQIEFYRAHYDAAKFPESAGADDLLVMTGAERAAFEQLLIGRGLEMIHVREPQQDDVQRGLRELLRTAPLTPFERDVVGDLIARDSTLR